MGTELTMTREQKIIRGKVGVLELAKQLGSPPPHGWLRHPIGGPLKLPRFRGRLAGRDQSFSAMALASYSMGER